MTVSRYPGGHINNDTSFSFLPFLQLMKQLQENGHCPSDFCRRPFRCALENPVSLIFTHVDLEDTCQKVPLSGGGQLKCTVCAEKCSPIQHFHLVIT